MVIQRELKIPMRDQTLLSTDLYRLDVNAPLPVLVARTPYDKSRMGGQIRPFVEAGYAVVIQDVRGRYASEGEFVPYAHETEDGIDCLKWVLNQPWCDGTIGTMGGSYLGGTQWLPARKSPPGLKAMIPEITFDDLYAGCQYQGGAKVLHDLRWTVADIIIDAARRARQRGEHMDIELPDVETALYESPLATHPAIEELTPYYREWLDHPLMCDYWAALSPNSGYGGVTVPALNISGWYDIFVPSTLNNYMRMKREGGSYAARKHQRLIMGPWSHMNFTGNFPEISYGEHASAEAVGLTDIKIRWYDRWLKGAMDSTGDEMPVKIFVMGINRWRDEADWPLPDTKYRAYYLHSGNGANTLHGDGTLSEEKPGDEPFDSYIFDPLNPVPTIGGQVILPGENAIGPKDQWEAENRDDVLVYTTPVLDVPLEVTGSIQLKLFASSDSLDTDFTAKLTDVFPDGRSMLLTDGILRARYRESFERPENLKPDTLYEFTIELGATANVFLPGHRLRLDISSSNFPKFDRNSNTGGVIAEESAAQYKTARNRVYHDGVHPSRLILPVIERDK